MDMLRLHKFGVGPYIVTDVGSPEQQIEQAADRCAFLIKSLGVKVPGRP
jgi:hypothetical protein